MQLILTKVSHPAVSSRQSAVGSLQSATRDPQPVSRIPHLPSVKNLIFDFGGVICNIDIRIMQKRFLALGWKVTDDPEVLKRQTVLFDGIESGAVSPQEFRDGLKPFFASPVSDAELDEAWNSLLLDIPEPRVRLLEDVRNGYRIFMLTNTNAIHYPVYRERFTEKYGYADFDGLFEKAYYSYRIGLKKPDPAIFRHVLEDSNLDTSETLFIDDTLMHVEGANAAGIHAHHLRIDSGEQIMDLFS